MQTESFLTLKETAAVAGVPASFVKKEVERRVVRPRRAKRHVFFPQTAPMYFAIVAEFLGKLEVAPALRTELYRLLTESLSPRTPGWERDENVVSLHGRSTEVKLDTTTLNQEIHARLELLKRRATRIHSDPEIKNGVPVFVGTRIPVANVRGQLARGATVDELVEDYPGLPREDILLAQLMNVLGRPPGRPKKFKPLRIVRI